ncbi:MAG: response regulator [Verrucomicrobiota bacterium]
MNKYSETILCVDDERSVLVSIKRALRGICEVEFADSAENALKALEGSESYAAIVSDMRMPGMNGIEFLEKARHLSSHSSRIMLTGDSDQSTAIDALNKGSLYRFLKKPFSNADFLASIEASIRHYQMEVAEKDLLQRTLQGSLQALVDLLSMADPNAFQMSGRLKEIASQLGRIQKLNPTWMLNISAMLAPVGYVTLPGGVPKSKASDGSKNREMIEAWRTSSQIVKRIPRLEKVSRAIELSLQQEVGALEKDRLVARLAATLKIADQYGRLRRRGLTKKEAIADLKDVKGEFEQISIAALNSVELPEDNMIVREIATARIEEGMIFSGDVFTLDGLMLAPDGIRASQAILNKMKNFAKEGRLPKTMKILFPNTGK